MKKQNEQKKENNSTISVLFLIAPTMEFSDKNKIYCTISVQCLFSTKMTFSDKNKTISVQLCLIAYEYQFTLYV